MMELTRRNFLAGGLAASALGIAGLVGCSPRQTLPQTTEQKIKAPLRRTRPVRTNALGKLRPSKFLTAI